MVDKRATFSPLHAMTQRNWIGRLRRSERGAAIIEMAALSPLLLVLVFGVGDFGRVMYHALTLTNAARAGAAYGSQSNGHSTDSTGIIQAAQEEAQNLGTITVTTQQICECTGGSATACSTASCSGYGAPMSFVEVTTSDTFVPLTGSFPGIPASTLITRVAKVRVQ